MTTATEFGFTLPTGNDLIKEGDNAITANAEVTARELTSLDVTLRAHTEARNEAYSVGDRYYADVAAAHAENDARDYADDQDALRVTEVKTYTDVEVSAAKWKRPLNTSINNLDTVLTAGEYELNHFISGRPFGQSGVMTVYPVDGYVIQEWTTRETVPRKFVRSRTNANPPVWNPWENFAWRAGSIPGNADFNTYVSAGVYEAPNGTTVNKPTSGTGSLEVFRIASGVVIQLFLTNDAVQRQFTRRLSGGTWTAWQTLTWYQGIVISGVDFNTLLTQGRWSVSFTNHPNAPENAPGSLEVFPQNTSIVQEFERTGDDPAVMRRSFTAGVWSEWTQRTFGIVIPEPGTGETAGPGDPVRAPIGVWNPTLTPYNQSQIVTEYSKDRTVGWNGSHSSGNLNETRDDGATWTLLHQFPSSFGSVQQMDNGELLVSVGVDPAPREIWVSSGYGTGTVTWSKSLTGSAPYVTFAKAWGINTYRNIVVVNEYGPKVSVPWNGYTVAAGQNARYTYLSTDYGKTFKIIFDLNEYLTVQQNGASTDGMHLHGVAFDPYWDRIWLTFGDNANGTLYSDDLGDTWQTADWNPAFGGGHQNVGIIALPKAILFGTDCYPNGVQRINRSEGKRSGTYPIEQAYTINPGVNDLTHLCQSIHKIEREGEDGPVLFGFGAETAVVPSHIVATIDGYTFTKLWEDTQAQAAGRGLRTIAGPNLKGELVMGSNDNRTANMWTKFTGPVPIY